VFTTIKAAKQAGYRTRKKWEYGGQEVTVKGRLLVRHPKAAVSKTEWSKRGYRVLDEAVPHSSRTFAFKSGASYTYDVYRDDQLKPKRTLVVRPPVLINVLAAVWVINRRTKRCRDQASNWYAKGAHSRAASAKEEKEQLNKLKSQALHYLVAEGRLKIVANHRFPDKNWAEVLKGDGYTFHRPCATKEGEAPDLINEIEAKPRGSKEPRLKDALFTINHFLEGKAKVGVFAWPEKIRPRWLSRHVDEPDDDQDDDQDDEDEWGF